MKSSSSQLQQEEAYIGRVFNRMSKFFIRKDRKEIEGSAKHHVDMILLNKDQIQTVVDVGSGAGGLMIKLLEEGIECVIGVDLSSKLTKETQSKIQQMGFEEHSKVIEGSFLDVDQKAADAVSLHASLCCHPNSSAILQKTTSLTPKLITLTLPRNWKILRLGLRIVKFFRIMKFFFLHDVKAIDQSLIHEGYQLDNVRNTLFWTTRTYIKRGIER